MFDIGPSRGAGRSERRAVHRPGPAQPPVDTQPQPERVEPTPPRAPAASVSHRPSKKKASWLQKLALIVAGIVLAGLTGWFIWSAQRGASLAVDPSKYQAVFFSNGQIYFGKLEAVDDRFMRLKNVFYIQSNSGTGATQDSQPQARSNNMQLIKLGEEVHGPEDAMMINRDQVLYFENLKSDGQVVKLINDYKPNR